MNSIPTNNRYLSNQFLQKLDDCTNFAQLVSYSQRVINEIGLENLSLYARISVAVKAAQLYASTQDKRNFIKMFNGSNIINLPTKLSKEIKPIFERGDQSYFTDLPIELLLHIFSYLTMPQKIRFKLVNSRYVNVIDSTNKQLIFGLNANQSIGCPEIQLNRWLNSFPQVTHFELKSGINLKHFKIIMRSLPFLTSLSLKSTLSCN